MRIVMLCSATAAMSALIVGCGALPLENSEDAASDDTLACLAEDCADDTDDTQDGNIDDIADGSVDRNSNEGIDDGDSDPTTERPDLGAFGRVGKIDIAQSITSIGIHAGFLFGGSHGKSIYKVDPVSGTVVDQLIPPGVGGNSFGAVAVSEPGVGYFVSDGWPTQVTKVDLNAFALVGAGVFGNENAPGKREGQAIGIHENNVYTGSSDGWSNGNQQFLTRWTDDGTDVVVSGDALSEINETGFKTLVVDGVGNHAYAATDTNPVKIVKFQLGDFQRVGALELPGTNRAEKGCFMDTARNQLVCASRSSPAKIYRIDLASFTIVGDPLEYADHSLVCAVYDEVTDKAYFGVNTAPAKVLKVDMATFTVEAVSAPFETGEDYTPGCALDPETGMLYFGVMNSASGIVAVAP